MLVFTILTLLYHSLPPFPRFGSPPWMISGPVSAGSLHWDIVELFGGVSRLPRARFLGPAKGHGCVQVLREGQLESWAPGEAKKAPVPLLPAEVLR